MASYGTVPPSQTQMRWIIIASKATSPENEPPSSEPHVITDLIFITIHRPNVLQINAGIPK
jgi:hypothetical protein